MNRVFAELVNHCGRATGPATFMRLVEKQLLARFRDEVQAALLSGSLNVSEQQWPIDDLEPLWSKNEVGAPQRDEGPIVILRVGGIDMLIDGHSRRRKRLRDRDRDTQGVLLVEVD